MSQSRFSIVLVGVSALLRRPLVSRLRPAGFTARGSGGFRRSVSPSVSEIATRRVDASAFHFGITARRVGLRAHAFRFSARTASELPLGGLALPPSASEIAARRVGLRAHCFRFSARIDPHRRTAEARTDGAQRHDNCFTSKHLSQHVNLPHRTP